MVLPEDINLNTQDAADFLRLDLEDFERYIETVPSLKDRQEFSLSTLKQIKADKEKHVFLVKDLPRSDIYIQAQLGLIQLGASFSYDEFLDKFFLHRADGKIFPVDKRVLRDLRTQLSYNKIRTTDKELNNAIEALGYRNVTNCLKEKLASLQWDGTERLKTWMIDHFHAADNPYTREISQLLLIAGIRRVKQPGCKYDIMFILEGQQGTSKSSAVKLLALEERFHQSDLELGADPKKTIEQTAGKWIIEIEELEGNSSHKINRIKKFLSKQEDTSRLAYGQIREDHPRHFIMVGTTNETDNVYDPSGARRFIPLEIPKRIDLAKFRDVVPQLWAEAWLKEPSLFQHGLWLSEENQHYSRKETAKRIDGGSVYDALLRVIPENAIGYVEKLDLFPAVEAVMGKHCPNEKSLEAQLGLAMIKLEFESAKATRTKGRRYYRGYQKDDPETPKISLETYVSRGEQN